MIVPAFLFRKFFKYMKVILMQFLIRVIKFKDIISHGLLFVKPKDNEKSIKFWSV